KNYKNESIEARSPSIVAEVLENSRRVVEVSLGNHRRFLLVFCFFYHNMSTLTHICDHQSKKQEHFGLVCGLIISSGSKDTLSFPNWTKDAHMRQNAGFVFTGRLLRSRERSQPL